MFVCLFEEINYNSKLFYLICFLIVKGYYYWQGKLLVLVVDVFVGAHDRVFNKPDMMRSNFDYWILTYAVRHLPTHGISIEFRKTMVMKV